MKDHQDRIGQQIGEYRLLRLLGRGTFGVVYLAQSTHEQESVALKLLQMPLFRPEGFKSFLNEARTIRLRHPHIVPLLDFGVSREELPYLVMEYAQGGTLRDRYTRGTQLPLATVDRYLMQMAAALHYAHERRVVHRDVKPENMLLRADGTVLLSDFGIARIVEQSTTASLGNAAGTPAYMAPEQSQGKPCPASDQYALAIVTYEWLAGNRPFVGTPMELAVQHRLDAPPSLCALRQDLPTEAEQVIMRALSKRPEERFVAIEQFAQALHLAFQQHSIARSTPASSTKAIPKLPVPPTPTSSLSSLAVPQQRALPSRAETPPASERPHPAPARPAQASALQSEATSLPMPKMGQEKAPLELSLTTQAGARETRSIEALSRERMTIPVPGSAEPASSPPVPAVKARMPPRLRRWTVSRWHVVILIGLALVTTGSSLLLGDSMRAGFLTITRSAPQRATASTQARPQLRWDFLTGGSSIDVPAIVNGVVYVGSDDDTLYAIDAASGRQKWAFPTGCGPLNTPVVANDVVYVSSDNCKISAIDAASGQQKWAFPLGVGALTSPEVINGVVYVSTGGYKLYAIDAISGQQKWVLSSRNGLLSLPTEANGVLYVTSEDALYAIDATSDRQKWTFPIHRQKWTFPIQDEFFPFSPTVANSVVYVSSGSYKVYAIDAVSGQQKWASPISNRGGYGIPSWSTVANGVVYVGTSLGTLYAIDATSGQQKWTSPLRAGVTSFPEAINGVVYVVSAESKLYAIDAASGQQKWVYPIPIALWVNVGGSQSPVVFDGVVYVASNNHELYAIDAASGQQKWAFPIGSGPLSPPAIVNRMIYVSSEDHKLYAIALPG